jgi:hypothetical protein
MEKLAYCGLWSLVLCGFASTGCKETVQGKYLDTEGIALVADVTAETDKESTVELSFLTGGDESNTYVDLAADKVTVTGDGVGKVLSAKSKGEYATKFASGAGGAKFSVALNRMESDKTDALKTSGTLPEPFKVSVDAAGDASRQDALTIKWAPFGEADSVRVDIDGDCVFFTFQDGEADDGEFVVPKNELIFGSDPKKDDGGNCDAVVTITRTRNGTVDKVFDTESKLRLHQVRSATFPSVP